MKSKRFQFEYRKNASKLHKAVGDYLREGLFTHHHESYQEYPVNRVNPDYPESSHHFDWVIPKMKLVIECHGIQHYQPVAFGGNYEQMEAEFNAIKRRDQQKKEAALQAGYAYMVISHHELKLIDDKLFLSRWDLALQEREEYHKNYEPPKPELSAKERYKLAQKQRQRDERKKYLQSRKHMEKLEKAREYRRERYRKLRDLRSSE